MYCMFARGTGSLVFLDKVTVEATGWIFKTYSLHCAEKLQD